MPRLYGAKKVVLVSACRMCLPDAFPRAGNIGPSGGNCKIMSCVLEYAARIVFQNFSPLSIPPAQRNVKLESFLVKDQIAHTFTVPYYTLPGYPIGLS